MDADNDAVEYQTSDETTKKGGQEELTLDLLPRESLNMKN